MKYISIAIIFALGGNTLSVAQEIGPSAESTEYPANPYKVTSQSLLEAFGDEGSLGIADQNAARAITSVGLTMIKHFEGLIKTAYNDPAGFCTIGYGHLIKLDVCEAVVSSDLKVITGDEFENGLSNLRANEILEQDTQYARRIVSRMVETDLTEDQFSALASFVFNVGGTNFSKSTLLSLLNEGAYDAASEEFPRWVKASGILLPGLVARRACEQALFRGDLEIIEGEEFDRANCQSLGIAVSTQTLIDIQVGE